MPAIYALLIGINGYPSKPLRGCINDVNAVEEYLHKMYDDSPSTTLHIRRLTDHDEMPTRQNIVNAFDFYAPATGNDICLLYYSGHGSFSKAPREFWTETDGFLESLVCIDSRVQGGRDLVDKELGILIARALAGKPEVTFVAITDCCHSGTITRAINEHEIIERTLEPDYMPQQLEDFLGFGDNIDGSPAYLLETLPNGQQKVSVRQSRHIHLAAAQDNQTAKELQIEGRQRGAFTFSLLRSLYARQGLLSYEELLKQVKLQVQYIVRNQDPLVNAHGGLGTRDLRQYFLTRTDSQSKPLFIVHWKQNTGWCIDAGAIHGVTAGDEVRVEGMPLLRIKAQSASDYSILEENAALSDNQQIYHASIKMQPNQKARVAFAQDIEPAVKQLINDAFISDAPAFVELTTATTSRFIIKSEKLLARLTLPGNDAPLFNPVMITDGPAATAFLGNVNTVSKWLNLQELANAQTTITNEHYSATLFRSREAAGYEDDDFEPVADTGEPADFHYRWQNGKWVQPALKLQLVNTSGQDLWFNCLYMGFDYAINASLLKQVRLPAGSSTWLTIIDKGMEKTVIKLNVEKKYLERGYHQIIEYLKLFVSTNNIDLGHFEQEGIELADLRTRGGEITAKGAGAEEEDATIKADDWATATIGLRITRSADVNTINPGKQTKTGDLVIEPHEHLQATFAITSSAEAARSADAALAPNKAHRNGSMEAFDLLPLTRSGTGTDVLELFGASNTKDVTPAKPLILTLPNTPIGETESVVAIGYDPETGLYFPVGYNDRNRIIINTLPPETPSDAAITQRSFLGSIKIYFQKILGKVGFKYDYPRLAIVQVSNNAEVSYTHDEKKVKEAVNKAKTILLFIHGIIGDTEGMVKCIKHRIENGQRTFEQGTDLVLAFDYENLNTPIEQNAALLKQRLKAVGLGEGHHKDLTIVAHSMGGLVSRWFIEKLGGSKVVRKLIMLGTPNNGTPWVDVRDLLESMLTFGINGAAFLQPWLFVINLAGKLAKGAQVAFKQMDSDTGIYKALNDTTDPGISYGIVAGNTQEMVADFDTKASAIAQLLTRLRKRGGYMALDALLFKKPNDIAVTVTSINTIAGSAGWKQIPATIEVPCDHLNYFSNNTAVNAIAGFIGMATVPPPSPPSPPSAAVEQKFMPLPEAPLPSPQPGHPRPSGGSSDRGGGTGFAEPKTTQEGQLEYDIPDIMKVDKVHRCIVKIAGAEVAAALLKVSEKSTHTDIRIAEEMSVKLIDVSGGDHFEIVAVSSERQAIIKGEATTWAFGVTPLKTGKHPLALKVTMHRENRNKDLDVLEKDVLISSEEAPADTGDTKSPKRILFLCANPKDTVRLRTEAEARMIKEEILMSAQRDNILFTLNVAVTPRTFSRSLMQEKPTIVHFSGHGEDKEGICFETDHGITQLVSATALGLLFRSLRHPPQCVVLNACYSEEQAAVIVNHIPFVIGMNKAIQDKAASAFSIGFYQALGEGYGVEEAFNMGLASMAMDSNGQQTIPVLLKKPG